MSRIRLTRVLMLAAIVQLAGCGNDHDAETGIRDNTNIVPQYQLKALEDAGNLEKTVMDAARRTDQAIEEQTN